MRRLLPILLVLGAVGYVLAPKGKSLGKPPSVRLMESDLVATISEGERFDVESHLQPGLWTLIEFSADW